MSSLYSSEKSCLSRLNYFLDEEKPGVAHFYRGDQATSSLEYATKRASHLVKSAVEGKLLGDVTKEIAKDLAVLALYDMAILIDDSGSMADEEGGERIEILKGVLGIINNIYRHASEPEIGIRAIRFMNNQGDKDCCSFNDPDELNELIKNHYFGGTTRIGTELHKKILKPLVLGEPSMKKPLLIMVITDGAIEGEKKGLLEKVIISCVNKLNDDKKGGRKQGADSVAFQFSCIGNDEGARKVLDELDDHQLVGPYVDCQKASQVLDLPMESSTVLKLLLGAILPKFDDPESDIESEFDIDTEDDTNTGGPDPPRPPPGGPRGNSRDNNQSLPYLPEANPNPGNFGPVHSQPQFQENPSEYPPGNPNPNQGPRPGQAFPGFAEALMDGQNIARGAQEEARRAVEEGRRKAEEFRRSLGEGVRSPMSQEESDEEEEEEELEEREDAEFEGGHASGWHNPDVD